MHQWRRFVPQRLQILRASWLSPGTMHFAASRSEAEDYSKAERSHLFASVADFFQFSLHAFQ